MAKNYYKQTLRCRINWNVYKVFLVKVHILSIVGHQWQVIRCEAYTLYGFFTKKNYIYDFGKIFCLGFWGYFTFGFEAARALCTSRTWAGNTQSSVSVHLTDSSVHAVTRWTNVWNLCEEKKCDETKDHIDNLFTTIFSLWGQCNYIFHSQKCPLLTDAEYVFTEIDGGTWKASKALWCEHNVQYSYSFQY